MLKKHFLVPIFVLLFPWQSAFAQNTQPADQMQYDLGTIEVTAPAWNHPDTITGKPAEELFFEVLPATGKTTLSEALDGQLGLHLRSSGGPGTVAGMSSGGLSGNKVLVVKDGLPVNDPFTGTPDIGDFSTLQFETAEFWQGNRATLWGSSSIGGTLRLTSRFPDSGRIRVWTDGHGGQGHAVETSITPGKAKIGVRLSRFNTPGISAAAQENGNTERDAFALDNAYLAMEASMGPAWQLQMSSEFNRSRTDLDGFDFVSGLPVDSLTFRQKKIGSQFNTGLIKTFADGEMRLTHAFGHTAFTGIDESDPFNEYGLEASQQRQAVSRSLVRNRQNWMIEVSRTEVRAENAGLFSVRETDAAGLLACESKIGAATSLNAVFRHDKAQSQSSVETGNLALQHKIGGLDVGAAWGKSFRMPALNERFYPAYGDSELGPEFSSSVALSVAGNAGRVGHLAVSATQYYVSDLIGTTATTDPVYTWGMKAANLDRARITSHQISLSELELAGCNIAADFVMLDRARLESTRTQIPGIASRQATAVVERKTGSTTWTCRGQWWGPVWENAENTRCAPDSHDISLFLRHNFKECSFEAGLLNLTDAEQQRVFGYTRPGRRLTLALEAFF
ncbi:MAG: hypothetical protein CVV42_10380 [Candidatus Riflebacteria bacterium HGW-Riflebacteria-2]|nr:MAG: hypothetical protein CVV42_10380 [Candidatus Riflebacteria bacterium HGW-Riflebacteria-2]